MPMGYGGYGVMIPPPMAVPMHFPMGMPYPETGHPTTTTTTTTPESQNGIDQKNGYATIVIPIPQFVTISVKIPNSPPNPNRPNPSPNRPNPNPCDNDDKKCQTCPPCSCNPCTPVYFAFCSPCHDQCKCKDDDKGKESAEKRRTSSPQMPPFPMPIAPIIFMPLPDFFNKNNGNRPHRKSSSCEHSGFSCNEDSCKSGKSKGRGQKKESRYDICRRTGKCDVPLRSSKNRNGHLRRRESKKREVRHGNKKVRRPQRDKT